MPVEIKFTADTMDELWKMLTTFGTPRISIPPGLSVPPELLKPDGVIMPLKPGEAFPSDDDEAPAKGKRGRPPGAKNKAPKVAEPEDTDNDPEPEAVPETEEEASPDATKKMLADALTVHWKENVKEKKAAINAFKAEIGIGMLAEMKPKDFPKARQVLKALDAMADTP